MTKILKVNNTKRIKKEAIIKKQESKIFVLGVVTIGVAGLLYIMLIVFIYLVDILSLFQIVLYVFTIALGLILFSIPMYLFEENYNRLQKLLKTKNKGAKKK